MPNAERRVKTNHKAQKKKEKEKLSMTSFQCSKNEKGLDRYTENHSSTGTRL